MGVKWNHSCCVDLQTGAKTVAVVQMVMTSIGVIMYTLLLIGGIVLLESNTTSQWTAFIYDAFNSRYNPTKKDITPYDVGIILIIGSSLALLMSLILLLNSVILWQGVRDRNEKKCKIWFTVSCIFLAVAFLKFVAEIYFEAHTADPILTAILTLIIIYSMYLVYLFRKELAEGENERLASQVMYNNREPSE